MELGKLVERVVELGFVDERGGVRRHGRRVDECCAVRGAFRGSEA
jgi:hypothetical protein